MKCILCGKNTNTLLTDTLRGGSKGKVYFCKSCELGMLEDHRSKKEIIDFYKDEYRKHPLHRESSSPQELFDLYVNFQIDRINLLKKYLNKNTILLEVGCSVGMFLYHVREYTNRIIGIDYDIDSINFATHKCGCLIYNNDIQHTGLPKKSFDIICLFQVLEHVKNPIEFISQYKDYLKPNGRMCIEVPNINDALRCAYNLPNYNRFYFHQAHLWYFSEKSLNILMKKAGFTGDIHFTQSYNILNHLHWIDTDTPKPNCLAGLSKPYLPARKGAANNILNSFISDMDLLYKRLLSGLKITDTITYIGKRNA